MNVIPSKAVPLNGTFANLGEDFEPMLLPRSIRECLTFVPWWRSLLSVCYSHQRKKAETSNVPWSLPQGESDLLVAELFSFHSFAACSTREMTSDVRWCVNTHHKVPQLGAKIRAMVVAGMKDEEIAPKFATTPARIALYVALFFDIRECLQLRHWMDTFLRPETPNIISGGSETNEVLWLTVAYHLGREILDHVTTGNLPFLTSDQLADICGSTCDMISGQAFMHTITNTMLHAEGRPVDLERHLRVLDIRSKADRSKGGDVSSEGGMEADEWFVEAANERKIFDPGRWNMVKGVSEGSSLASETSSGASRNIPLEVIPGSTSRRKLLDSVFSPAKPSCKTPLRDVTFQP